MKEITDQLDRHPSCYRILISSISVLEGLPTRGRMVGTKNVINHSSQKIHIPSISEEKEAFSLHINNCLSDDCHASRHLPLNVQGNDLFEKCSDGLILCKLINLASPNTIDERSLNVKDAMNVFQRNENANIALNAAKAIGCQVVNIGSSDIVAGR